MTTKLSDLHYVLLAHCRQARKRQHPAAVDQHRCNPHRSHACDQDAHQERPGERGRKNDDPSVWRANGDRKLGVIITDAGRTAVAKADGKKREETAPSACDSEAPLQLPPESELAPAVSAGVKSRTKQSLVLAILNRRRGPLRRTLFAAPEKRPQVGHGRTAKTVAVLRHRHWRLKSPRIAPIFRRTARRTKMLRNCGLRGALAVVRTSVLHFPVARSGQLLAQDFRGLRAGQCGKDEFARICGHRRQSPPTSNFMVPTQSRANH